MERISEFMDGKKTYTGIVFMLLGIFGIARYFGTEGEFANLVNTGLEFFGAVFAVYGRYKATRKK